MEKYPPKLKSRSRSSRREQFFLQLKTRHPNLYAIYLMVSIVSIWSGCWYLGDTWAHGQNLLAPALIVTPDVVWRHLSLLVLGLLILYIDDHSLQELILMKASSDAKPNDDQKSSGNGFKNFKHRHPNLGAICTYLSIIAAWCGMWGLLWDLPIQPFWRSLLTIHLGFLMLYLDDFKLTEI